MTESLSRLAYEELARAGSREAAWPRIGGFGHVARIRGLLGQALAELDDAAAALLANIAEQESLEARGEPSEELFEEGGRLSRTVHLRVETIVALTRLVLDWVPQAIERYLGPVDLPPALVDQARRLGDELRGDRDLHVALAANGRLGTASVWALSGDASTSPGTAPRSIVPSELVDRLDAYVDDAVSYCVTNSAD